MTLWSTRSQRISSVAQAQAWQGRGRCLFHRWTMPWILVLEPRENLRFSATGEKKRCQISLLALGIKFLFKFQITVTQDLDNVYISTGLTEQVVGHLV